MGDEVDFNSKETVNRSKADTNSKFNRKMNFTVNLIRQTRGKDLIYTEWKYPSSEEQRNDISPSHYITCIGYDPPFGQRERVELTKEVSCALVNMRDVLITVELARSLRFTVLPSQRMMVNSVVLVSKVVE